MSNEIMTVQERIAQQLARQNEAAAGLRTTGSFISFKNATLKVDGVPIPGNTADVRVLAAVPERVWYADGFDADVVQVPTCYSFDSPSINAMAGPHPEAADPQSVTCETCPKNKWGSAPPRGNTPSRGKACREGARVVVIPANVPLKSAPLYLAKIPVSSLSAVTAFTSRCSQANKLMGEFVTALSVSEDKKSFFKVHLTIKELSSDLDLAELLTKQDAAYSLANQPYPQID